MNRRRFALLVLTCLVGASALFFGAGAILSRPASRPVGPPPVDFPAQIVRIPVAPGQFVVGWFAPGQATKGVVLLLHGVRSDRRQMLGRARSLNRLGYAALLIDLPAHGESSGERITFGAQEAAGVTAAVEFLRGKLPGERLGIIGVSLGAAATVLANLRPAPNAVVLESMYPTIEEAVAGRPRMRLGSAGASLAPFLLWQLPLWTGIGPQDLRPIRLLEDLGAPVLVASGAEDRHTTWAETERLFQSAKQPKELWRVDGAAHIDLPTFQPDEYECRVFGFLARYLRSGA